VSVQPEQRLSQPSAGFAPLHLALVEPQIPPNTGNVARLCAATGCRLHLVEPLGFRIDDRELKRAGLDYWAHVDVTVHASLQSFMHETQRWNRWFFSTGGSRRYCDADFQAGDVLIFGKETAGLPRDLIETHAARTLRIPMRAQTTRSLNLSTAVGLAAYRALERIGFPNLI